MVGLLLPPTKWWHSHTHLSAVCVPFGARHRHCCSHSDCLSCCCCCTHLSASRFLAALSTQHTLSLSLLFSITIEIAPVATQSTLQLWSIRAFYSTAESHRCLCVYLYDLVTTPAPRTLPPSFRSRLATLLTPFTLHVAYQAPVSPICTILGIRLAHRGWFQLRVSRTLGSRGYYSCYGPCVHDDMVHTQRPTDRSTGQPVGREPLPCYGTRSDSAQLGRSDVMVVRVAIVMMVRATRR